MHEPSTSIFGRRPSLFHGHGKRRKGSITPVSPSVPEEKETETSPRDTRRTRESSIVSLPVSISGTSLHRSHSSASRDSRDSASLNRHKSRAPSVANVNSRSPVRRHRVSRSISANAVNAGRKFGSFSSAISPQKSHESIVQTNLSPAEGEIPLSAFEAPPKTPFSMLVNPRGHGIKRQDTATTFASHSRPSISGENGFGPPVAHSLNPVAIYNSISEVTNKRIATLEYLRKAHEGQIHYFNTLHYTAKDVNHMPSMLPARLSRRATNYFLLGTSLPPLMDLNASSPLEYLRALCLLLAEFDTFQNADHSTSGTRGRVGQMFKSGMRMRTGRRSSSAMDVGIMEMENSSSTTLDAMPAPPVASYSHRQEFTYLQTPLLPFDPDFHTSFATLMDILIDTYDGLMQILPGPEACNPAVNEAFIKADRMLRKILVQNVVQEFGDNTRKEVKSEVAALGKVVLGGLM